jgi:hypothetical protein
MKTKFAFNPLTSRLDLVNISASATSGANFILNPNAEIDTASWNLYNDTGRTVPASLLNQDLTFTSTLSGGGGNGVDIEYIYNAGYPAATPNINVISPVHVQVRWNNGPTIANNPTATQLKAAWDAVPAAVAIATVAITGTASNLQYITGHGYLTNGGDTAPTDGSGGVVTGVTFTRSTVNPIEGIASFILSKDAASREGMGVSTDFTIDNRDKGKLLEVSVDYSGSSGMVLGTASDVVFWIYDVTNAILIPISPRYTLKGPTGTILTFVGTFTASATSLSYRLIFHIGTANATTWDLQLDDVVVTDIVSPDVNKVPSLVLQEQPVSGAVTDHMCVMWRDGALQWVPATIAGAALPAYGSDKTQLGFATNIVGGSADIYIRGYMDGFSFGPFVGYDQFIDNVAGGISPLPAPFNDLYVVVGMAISSTVLNIQFDPHDDLIANTSGVPLKGGLLSNSAINDGTGDQVLAVGANGNVLVANSAAGLGINWAAAVVAAAPFTYTLATRTLTIATATNSVAGVMSAADHTLLHNAITIGTANGLSLSTQVLSLAAATDSVPGAMSAADHTNFTLNTAARHAAVTIGTANGLSLSTQALSLAAATNSVPGALTAADHTTYSGYAATIALKAPLASPVFTGDVNSSTGNVLISTIGKGVQIKTGANSKIGTSVLVAGTVTVANTSVTANSRIFLTSQADGGTPGWLRITTKTVGTSFVITSSSATDTSTVAWTIFESIP